MDVFHGNLNANTEEIGIKFGIKRHPILFLGYRGRCPAWIPDQSLNQAVLPNAHFGRIPFMEIAGDRGAPHVRIGPQPLYTGTGYIILPGFMAEGTDHGGFARHFDQSDIRLIDRTAQ